MLDFGLQNTVSYFVGITFPHVVYCVRAWVFTVVEMKVSNVAMENLEESWTCLSLSEYEGEVFTFENQECRKEYMLVVKFFMKRAINIDVVARTLKPLWRTK